MPARFAVSEKMSSEPPFTIEDLRNWQRPAGTSLAVAGHPVAHSLSPEMHNAALDFLGDKTRRYFKFDIDPGDLPEALKLFFEKGFLGLNLTIPHKINALPELVRLTDSAKLTGAANTLFRVPGAAAFAGTNTDGEGFFNAVSSAFPQTDNFSKTDILLLGAGGAARAIAFAAAAHGCKSLCIRNRTRKTAETLAKAVKNAFPQTDVHCDEKRVPEGTLLVNATSLGLRADDVPPLPRGEFDALRPSAVYDITYGNNTPALVALARSAGVPAEDGRTMLAWQGALAAEVWLGVPAASLVNTMLGKIKQL